MKKFFKTFLLNILVLLGLLIAVNFLCVLVFETRSLYQVLVSRKVLGDDRYQVENYKKIPWAKKHFEEFNSLPTEYRSYIGWRRLNFNGETINIDSSGIRKSEQGNGAIEDSIKITFLGGSTMWGTGVDDANTIPSLISKKANGNYFVYNFGEAGYNSFQGYLFLKLQTLYGHKTDVIVSYDGFNDGYYLSDKPEDRYSHAREPGMIFRLKGSDQKTNLTFKSFFFAPVSEFISKSLQVQGNTKSLQCSKEQLVAGATQLLDSWLSSKKLANEIGAKYICVLQPHAKFGTPDISHLNVEDRGNWVEYYGFVIDLLQTEKYKILQDSFLDLSHVFDSSEKVYVDYCHLSPNGNQVIAEKILEHLSLIKK